MPEERHLPLLDALSRRDLVGLELRGAPRWACAGADRDAAAAPARAARRAARCSTAPTGPRPTAVEGLRALHELLDERGVADRVIFDLGLVRELGYYTGAVFEVYDPAVGFTLGGGGRYDDLIGRFGRDLPACGVALDVQRVHLAQAAEEALAMSEHGSRSPCRAALSSRDARPARRARRRHARGALERPQAAVRRTPAS